jgi:inositol transport system substrate-binding protein
MKKLMAFILAMVFVLVIFGGCAASKVKQDSSSPVASSSSAAPAASASSAAPVESKKIKIGYMHQNLQNEFVKIMQTGADAKAAELGVELIQLDGEGKIDKQLSQAENLISQKVDAIILNPFDRDGCAPIVDKCNAANIPIIVVGGEVSNIDKATSHVGSDDVESGVMETEYMAKLLNGKGNIVVIHGPNGHAAEVNRTKGMQQVLAKYPDIKIIAEQTANWDRAQALTLMENWIQTGKQIDGVLAQNDEMAMGALKAIESANLLGKIKVMGIDAIPDAVLAVEAGKLDATVFQDAKGQGGTAVEVAYKAAMKESFEKKVMIPYVVVDKSNVAQYKKNE